MVKLQAGGRRHVQRTGRRTAAPPTGDRSDHRRGCGIQRGDPDATRQDLMDGVECIYETTRSVLVASEKRGVAPSQVADQLADEMLQQAKSAQV